MRSSFGSVGALRGQFAELVLARGRRGPIDPRFLKAAEILLALAIGAVVVSILWNLAGPVSRPSATPHLSDAPAPASGAGPINPFRVASEIAPPADEGTLGYGPDLAETTLNLVLHGTWTTPEGGAAFIKTPDEKQGRYSVGDAITGGVKLENIYRDQVVINRGGVRESLRLINRDRVAPLPAPTAAAPGDDKIAADVDSAVAIGNLISAQPVASPDGGVRLVLEPAGDEEAFERLGLRDGDILVAINNQPLGSDVTSAMRAIADLGGKQRVTVSVERDGVVLPVLLAAPGADGRIE